MMYQRTLTRKFISTTGGGSGNSPASPYLITDHWTFLLANPTLMANSWGFLASGNYTGGSGGMINPPAGTVFGKEGGLVNLKATTDGGVDFNGGGTLTPVKGTTGNDYFGLYGFDAHDSVGNVYEIQHVNNWYVSRCMGWNADLLANFHVFAVNYGVGNVLEDCGQFGNARKGYVSFQNVGPNTFRRCWGRWQASYNVGPKQTMSAHHDAYGTIIENGMFTWDQSYLNVQRPAYNNDALLVSATSATSFTLPAPASLPVLQSFTVATGDAANFDPPRARVWSTATPSNYIEGAVYCNPQTVATANALTFNGTFTLSFNGASVGPYTVGTAAATLQTDLNNLSTIGGVGGSVTVSLASNVYTITFAGTLTGPQPKLVPTYQGGASVAVKPTSGSALSIFADTVSGSGGPFTDWNGTLLYGAFTTDQPQGPGTSDNNLAGDGWSNTAPTALNIAWRGCLAYQKTGQKADLGTYLMGNVGGGDNLTVQDYVVYYPQSGFAGCFTFNLTNGPTPTGDVMTNAMEFAANSLGPIFGTAWAGRTNYVATSQEPSTFYAGLGGGENVYTKGSNGSPTGAKLRYRYIRGQLKDGSDGFLPVPLWPWPMNGRIQAAIAKTGYTIEDFDTWRKGIFGKSPDE